VNSLTTVYFENTKNSEKRIAFENFCYTMGKSQNVRVCVRFRPINSREKSEVVPYSVNIKYVDSMSLEIESNNPVLTSNADLKYSYDCVFPPHTSQEFFYENSCKDVVDDVLKGYNGTIFAYGQTGAGR